MSVEQPIENTTKRTLLGGAMSFEFSDCNVDAAKINAAVHDRFINPLRENGKKYCKGDGIRQLTFIQDGEIQHIEADTKFVLDSDHSDEEGRSVSWAFIRPITDSPKSRFSLLRKAVHITAPSDPLLVVLYKNESIAVPIASFANRESGRCSYVQLGSEMQDDSFYVTANDDETPRHKVITQLLQIASKGSDFKQVESGYIEKLCNEEVQKNHLVLSEAIEKATVSDLTQEAHKDKATGYTGKTQVYMLDQDEGIVSQFDAVSYNKTTLSDGRGVQLCRLHHPMTGLIQFALKTRGNVAIPLFELDDAEGRVVFTDVEEELIEDDRRNLINFIGALNGSRQSILNGQFYSLLKAKERFDQLLGKFTKKHEELIEKIASLNGQGTDFRGVVPDVLIGKATGDVEVMAKIEHSNVKEYTVTLFGKPKDMAKETPRQFMSFSLDLSKPLAEQLNGSAEHIDEIMNILSVLSRSR